MHATTTHTDRKERGLVDDTLHTQEAEYSSLLVFANRSQSNHRPSVFVIQESTSSSSCAHPKRMDWWSSLVASHYTADAPAGASCYAESSPSSSLSRDTKATPLLKNPQGLPAAQETVQSSRSSSSSSSCCRSVRTLEDNDNAPAQTPPEINDDEDDDIRAALHSWSAAWNRGDLSAYLEAYAEDARYVSESLARVTTKRKKTTTTPQEDDTNGSNSNDHHHHHHDETNAATYSRRRSEEMVLHGASAIATLFRDVFERAKRYQSRQAQPTGGVAGRLTYSHMDIRRIGDRDAMVFGHYTLRLSSPSSDDADALVDTGVFTLHVVWTSTGDGKDDDSDGRWTIQSEHSSSTPPQSALT